MAKITNFMTRNFIARKPRDGSAPIILSVKAQSLGDIVIPPGECGEVPFWDQVKNHPIYQNYLDRKKIGVDAGEVKPTEHFTSADDTLKAPERLDPEAMKEEAEAGKLKNLAYENEPAISTKRKGGRKSNAEKAADPEAMKVAAEAEGKKE
jgi:hypothetical protein